MPMPLKYVDPSRPRRWVTRAVATVATMRVGRFISRHLLWKLDPLLLRATDGRFSLALVVRTAVLETQGAKTGALRRHAVIYFHDAERVTIIASHAGSARHPAWYHNLRAEPNVTLNGIPMRAIVITDEPTRQRLWTLADRVFAPFATYRREAAKWHRTIPIVQLVAR